jgi:hypothetical protein
LATLLIEKIIATPTQKSDEWRYAPAAAPVTTAGSEADLETRTDEPPLQRQAGIEEAIDDLGRALGASTIEGVLHVQSAAAAGPLFVRTPSVFVVEAAADWDTTAVSTALTRAAASLWSTSTIGAQWRPAKAGTHDVEQLNGLGKLMFAVRGKLLFVGSDPVLLGTVLDREAVGGSGKGSDTYAAGVRVRRARPNYVRIMTALDFGAAGPAAHEPAFFSENLASLTAVLTRVANIEVSEIDAGSKVSQTVRYALVE